MRRLLLCLLFGIVSLTYAQKTNITKKEPAKMTRATGTFDVKMTPQAPEEKSDDPQVGRWTMDKQFHGDLEATSKGQMLACSTTVKGSSRYVAMDRMTVSLICLK